MTILSDFSFGVDRFISRKNFHAGLLASSFLVMFGAPSTRVFAQGNPMPADTNALIAERDQLQASIARGDDGRSAEMAKLAVADKELARGKPFTPDEAKKESLLAEQDILIKAKGKSDATGGKPNGAGRDAFTQKDDERLAVVGMTLALGRSPTADEQKALHERTIEREKLQGDLSRGKADSYVTAGQLAALDKELAQGKPLSADESKREVLLGEQAFLSKQKSPADQIGIFREPTKRIDQSNPVQLAVVNATLALGRDPTPDERKQIESKVAERDKLQIAVLKKNADTYVAAGKLAALNKELTQGKPFTPEESRKEVLLAQQAFLRDQKPAPDQIGIFREPTKRIDMSNPTQLAVINATLTAGRDLTPDERKQIETKVVERNKLQDDLSKRKADSFVTAGKLAALDKELAQGKPFTADQSKREVLLGEQDYLSKQKPDSPNQIGIFREPTKRPTTPSNTMQLAVVSMTLALGREPTPDERKQLESKVTERQMLQGDMSKLKADTYVTAGKLAALDKEILQGKPSTPAESKRDVLLGEQAYLQKQKPDQIGIFREPIKHSQYDPVQLAAVTMALAIGRDPTPDERKQLESKVLEREKLQFDLSRKKPDAFVTAGKLAALDKELSSGKPFPPEQSRREVLLGEKAYLDKQNVSVDQIGIFREPTKRPLANPVDLAVVNMALALGRDVTPDERKQIESKVAARDRMQSDIGKGGNGTRSADLRKLAALDSEIDKRQPKNAGDAKSPAPVPNAAIVGAAAAGAAAGAGAAKVAIPLIGKRAVFVPNAMAQRPDAARAARTGNAKALVSLKPLQSTDASSQAAKALLRRNPALRLESASKSKLVVPAKPAIAARVVTPVKVATPAKVLAPTLASKPVKVELPKTGAGLQRRP